MAEIREIKVAFNDYRADLTLDVGFEGNIPMDAPLLALPEVVNINIINSLSDGSAIAYYRDADNADVSTILYANTTLQVLKNSKISIGRTNPRLFNITNIKVTSQDGTLLKDTNANLFDLENIQQPQTINITSQKLLTTENLARFITVLDSAYKFNTEIENEFTINVATQNATYVKYYFPNQPGADANGAKIVPVTEGSANVILSNPNAVGIYELIIIAGNEILKDGDEQRARINVIRERTYGQPDVTNIIFDRNITEADLRPLDFDFNFDIDTVNSEGVDVFLGDNLIFNTPIANGEAKIKLPAKSLYNSYKTFFNESDSNYEITFSLQPYFNGIGGKIVGKKESFTIFVERAKYIVSSGEVLDVFTGVFSQLFSGNDTKANFEDKIVFEDDKHLYYQVKTDNDSSFVITNTAVDDVTFSLENGKIVPSRFEIDPENGSTKKVRNQGTYNSLVVKLLEPIDENVVENQLVWISKQIIPSIVETIIINDTDDNECIALTPNFTVDVVDETGFEFFNQIVSSGSVTSTNIVNQYLSKSQFSLEDLNIDYSSGSNVTSSYFVVFDNFVNFSSAKTRIENFQYKIETIENWENKITSTLYSSSVLSTSSISLLTSASYNDKIHAIRNGFDGFEKTMYFDYGINSSNSQFFEIQTDYAEVYDRNNKNYLVKHLPQYIQEDSASNEFLIFMEMIGQHFDVIWSYINGINRIRKISNKSTDGISDKLVYTLLESFGWDPAQPFSGQQLWKQAFGLNEDGSTNSNSNVLGNDVGSSFTPEQARNQVWRRILNNLPYLLKHKGTKKAINAIMACYGVPSSLLTIVEFGGPANSGSQSTKYTYEDRTAALNIARDEYLTVDWKEGTSFNDPDAIELRFKTSVLPFVSQSTTLYHTQSLVNIGGGGSGIWNVKLVPSGSTIYGDIVFQMSASSNIYISPGVVTPGSELVSMSIQNVPIFDNTYKHFTIQREVVSRDEYVGNTLTRSLDYEQYTMFYKQANGDRISLSESDELNLLITSGSGSLVSNAKYYTGIGWLSGSNVNFGGQNAGGISGSIDEVRIWGGALSESVVTSHTLNPDTIFGNDVYSSTSDLFFRLDFEYPKNRQISGSGITSGDRFIKNVAPFVTYTSSLDSNGKEGVASGYSGYATASIFATASSYPYHYDVYERFVTAEVPSIGFVGKDKVRTEDITLTGQLSYKQRATKKAYDRAPIDSNRLGLFFSPVKEINLDILRSLGPINIGDYIGDWDEEYGTDTYADLDQLRNYYFERTQLNFDEYIKLIKSIDKSLFDMLTQVIPVRANVSKGLLIEPSLLERSKIKINRPVAENILHTASINTMDNILIEMSVPTYTGSLNMNDGITFEATLPYYSGSYDIIENLNITTEYPTYGGNYSVIGNITSSASILSNLPNAGGIIIGIDCGLKNPTILGEVDLEDAYQQVGNDVDSPFNRGFGIVGLNGAVDRTYYDDNGNLILTQRYNSYIITVKYTRSIPRRVPANGLSSSLFNTTKLSATDKVVLEKVERYEKKLILIDTLDYSLQSVTGFNVNVTGSGYTIPPLVTISGGAASGVGASGSAIIQSTGQVASLKLESSGSGYTSVPSVSIALPDIPGGVPATASALLSASAVVGFNVIVSGSGYTVSPVVTISGGGGSGASGSALITRTGVFSLKVENGGSGYDPNDLPSVSIATPNASGVTAQATAIVGFPFRGPLQHSFYIDILANLGTYPYKNGIITAIEPFVGLTSGHYSNTKDTARGLENSFYGGSKQTSRTTLDGTPAVETFSTNPNRLRVGPTGRGSGEPILEVD